MNNTTIDAVMSLALGILSALTIWTGAWPWVSALLAVCAGICGFLAGMDRTGRRKQ